ncbi:hypothetical protein [Pelagibius sp.]|uniref:hypothetical protein n=1 Tax=Pelagibius sp. TaxID=1931238 RepID=UPI0026272789|nr:hypothetical protein [Pelagibius sp.]
MIRLGDERGRPRTPPADWPDTATEDAMKAALAHLRALVAHSPVAQSYLDDAAKSLALAQIVESEERGAYWHASGYLRSNNQESG